MIKIKRRDGFEGEKYISIPELIWKKAIKENSFMANLYITYIGYFPKAAHHFRERHNGCKDNILIYCTRGKGWFILNEKRFEVGPNEFIIVPSTKFKMSYGADEVDPWTIYWVHFSGKDMDDFNRSFNIKLTDGTRQITYNAKGLELWNNMYSNLSMGYSIENLTNTNLCLYHFLSTFFYPEKHTDQKLQEEKDLFKDTIKYMQEHLNERITVDELRVKLVTLLHISPIFLKNRRECLPWITLFTLKCKKLVYFFTDQK